MRVAFGTRAANAWSKKFLRQLASEIDELYSNEAQRRQKTQAMLNRICGTAQQLFDADKERLPDKQAYMVQGACCMVLAAYRILKDQSQDQQQAFALVRAAFQRTYRGMGKFMMRPLLWFSRDPVKTLTSSDRTMKWSRRMYGVSMGFAQEADADSYTLVVNRCAFHQFFVDHDEATLTPLICEWDRNWMDVVDASTRPVRTERPTTISTGSQTCRFRFVRAADKTAADERDVILQNRES